MTSVKNEEDEGTGSQDHWYLVDTHGQKFRLPKTMLFLGREECDVVVASQSVDKRHAVLTFDLYLNRFKVKDLSTTNGTYVNNSRISEEEYVTLNHMDSIRLGQDAMMYHIEQGSQISSHDGPLPDPHYIPSWASRAQDSTTIHVHAHTLAECQGCIAEQKIQHTCSVKLERGSTDDDIPVSDIKQLVDQHTAHHHHKEGHAMETQLSTQQPASVLTSHLKDDHHCLKHRLPDQPADMQHKYSDTSREQYAQLEDETSSVEATSDQHPDSPITDRNTWPRKRQVRKTAHVGSVFISEAPEDSPALASEAHPAGAVQTMFFVTFDESVCNADGRSSQAGQKRQSQKNRNSHPSELATVKKGTPLYGQPSWWGEVEGEASVAGSSKPDGENTCSSKNSRPTNLGLRSSEASRSSKPGAVSKAGIMELDHGKPYSNPTYMEIPIKDEASPVRADKLKDAPTPAKSVSSSLSKDSLSVSPELKQPNKTVKTQSPGLDVNPSTSFTIDLDDPDHPPKKSLNIGSSISEFVPSKIRKNFRERKAVPSKTSSKESTPSRNSEDQEMSPLSQRKIDEIWSMAAELKGKSRLSSMQAAMGSSLRSPNLEEIDRLSEFSDERRSLEKESDRRGSLKRPGSNKSPQMSLKVASSTSIGPSSKSPAGVSVSHYADPTSYLIDRMFEGGSSGTVRTDKQQSPELKMYREAVDYDKIIAGGRSTDKLLTRPIIASASSLPAASVSARKTTSMRTVPQAVVHDSDDDDDEDDLRITEDIPDSDNAADEKDDKEDKSSEAGTYTIEADVKEGKEEEEARKRIDQVFGVDVESFNTDQPSIDPLRLASPGGYDNVYDFDDDDDGDRTPLDENCQSPVEGDADLTMEDAGDGESGDMTGSEDVQMWVSQLTALTNQKSADANRAVKDDGDASLSKKPPQGVSRKRPGTGRKLPLIPSDKSPVSSEHDSQTAEQDLLPEDDVNAARTLNHTANGRSSAESIGKPRPNSGLPRSRTISNGHPASPSGSIRSRGSVDTEVLLQDTETVMAAIQARISHKSGHGRKGSYSQDSDTDASSTVALVNGDENYTKPTLYKSPRDALAHRQKNDLLIKSAIASSAGPATQGKKPVVQSYSQTVVPRSMASPRSIPSSSGTRKSIVSNVISRRDSMDNDSIISDVSSDAGEGNTRSSSKGKGIITMTRTNKTFDLRRARVDSFDESTTPKSVRSSASSKPLSSVGRSRSLHSTTRNRSLTTTSRSEATSLGAQIVKKSQTNLTEEKGRKAGNTVASRTDSGSNRHSQQGRLQHSNSVAAPHPAVGSTGGKRESTPKSQTRLTPTKSALAITGISNVSTRSQSQPGSRSNSPKSAEKMAWKRRKEYDARKSVADAKAGKTKESVPPGVTMRPKLSTNSSVHRRMIRSASYTNTAPLPLGIHNSGSSSQDLSDRRDSYNHHEDFRRAFIPFHNSLRHDRSTHSADEDDSLVSANSAQDVARSLVSLMEPLSAFTPPPQRNQSVSPALTPPSKIYLSLRRRTLNMDRTSLAAELKVNGYIEDLKQSKVQSTPQTSYDSLIVASIYQLSLKLKTSTDKILSKLRDENRVSHTPSPIDDFLSDSSKSELPAWKTANQELAGTLKNLRKLEHHVHMMNTVIFPDVDVNSEVSSDVPASRQVKQRLLEDIERKFGFQPIDHPHTDDGDFASPEMAEFSGQF